MPIAAEKFISFMTLTYAKEVKDVIIDSTISSCNANDQMSYMICCFLEFFSLKPLVTRR